MFCQYCGSEIKEGSSVCENCGKTLIPPVLDDEAIINQKQENSSETEASVLKEPFKKNIWLLPLFTAILVAAVLSGYYFYEKNVDRLVEQKRVQAEELALKGELDAAEKLISDALKKRPLHKALQKDLSFIKEGKEILNKLNEAWEYAKKQQFEQALSLIEEAEKKIYGKAGDFFKYLSSRINDKKSAVTIMQVKQEMNDKNSVEELAALLTKVSTFKVKEAQEVAEAIKSKICQIIYAEANELLKKKDFDGALALVEKGLSYDSKNKQLLSFQQTIEQQKEAFEQREKMALEQALIAAAQEEIINTTQAVEVLEYSGSVTSLGDFKVWGTVKNIATRPIYMVEIYFTVYDSYGNALISDSAYVYPNYLNPREKGYFEGIIYGLWQGNKVKIDSITWYLG
ncbi:MAG: hypothetical protein XD50_0664 [Clostridia bacterium 41_269]|nr:MAG: hypothetical protein XD50_0664 [Clostridia bacterium 41_269]